VRSLNNITTSDAYTSASTCEQPETIKVNILVANNAIFCQMADVAPGMQHSDSYKQEVFYPPGYYNLVRRTNAVRVRSAVAGTPAQVTIEMLNSYD